MSNRRLAPDDVQPASFAFSPENLAWAQQRIACYPAGKQASAVIPLLMRAQEQHANWLPKAAIEYIALMLDMPFIRVFEVATFYTQFQLSPVGTKAHIQVCGTTPCMIRGAGDLIQMCKSRIHEHPFHPNADGTLSWEEVECAGACVNAPMVQVFSDTYEDLDAASFKALIDAFEKGEIPPTGPRKDRVLAAPEGGPVTLLDPALYDGSKVGSWKSAFDERVAAAKAAAEAKAAADAAAAADKPKA
jgi:NADH-quinone oxidoreductase subunit E